MTRRSPVVAVVSNKGGVGKSTTALNVGVEAARRGLSVLLVDADKQADLTAYAGLDIQPWKGLDGVLSAPPGSLDPRPFLRPRVTFSGQPDDRVHVLGSSPLLPEVDEVIRSGFDEGTFYLQRAFDRIAGEFDLVLVDLGHSTELVRNVLACADLIVVPTPANFPDARHAGDMLHEVARVRGELGLSAIELGERAVVSAWRRHPNASGDRHVLEKLKHAYGECLSPAVLPECSYVSEANASHMTVREFQDQYRRTGAAMHALVDGYAALTDFMLSRLPLEVAA